MTEVHVHSVRRVSPCDCRPDIARDDRYLQIRTHEHLTVRPATPNDLTTCFATWIDRALQRLRDDRPGTW